MRFCWTAGFIRDANRDHNDSLQKAIGAAGPDNDDAPIAERLPALQVQLNNYFCGGWRMSTSIRERPTGVENNN